MLPRVKKMWDEYRHMNYLKLNGGEDPCAAIRLRAEQAEAKLARWQEDTNAILAQRDDLQARCKRLEEALKKIEDKDSSTARGIWAYGQFAKIARKALEDK